MSGRLPVMCPACMAMLKVPSERLGRKVRCSQCAEVFVAEAMEETEQDEQEYAPLPARRSGAAKSTGRKTGKKSLGKSKALLAAGAGLVVLGIVALVVFLTRSGSDKPAADVAQADSGNGATTPEPLPGSTENSTAEPVAAKVPPATVPVAFNTTGKLPRAVTTLPEWLIKDAPFDVKQFWVTVPQDQNAAPLYLDALYEFSPLMEVCFAEDVRSQRTPVVKTRAERSLEMQKKWIPSQQKMDVAERYAVLEDHTAAFQKLIAAQQRPQCVFDYAVDTNSMMPLLIAGRNVMRLAVFHVERDIERKDFDHALQMIAMSLRLCRDLRVRGSSLMQTFAQSFESAADLQMTQPLLKSPLLTPSHCDQLLKLLKSHETQLRTMDPWLTAQKANYIRFRLLLHDIQNQSGEFAEVRIRNAFDVPNTSRLEAIFNAVFDSDGGLDGNTPEVGRKQHKQRMERLALGINSFLPFIKAKDFDFDAENSLLNDQYRIYTESAAQNYAARKTSAEPVAFTFGNKAVEDFMTSLPLNTPTDQKNAAGLKALSEGKIKGPFMLLVPVFRMRELNFGWGSNFTDSDVTGKTRFQAQIALVALRRWYGAHRDPRPDLAAVCREAGITDLPRDFYSDGPLKLKTFSVDTPIQHPFNAQLKALAGETIVYSIGSDGIDDGGVKEFDFRTKSGDNLFRLEVSQSTFAASGAPTP